MLLEIIIAVVLAVAFLVEVVLTETEHFGWSTVVLVATGAVCYYFNLYGLALWVKAHVAETLLFIAVYLIVGIVWSFIKWASYLISYRDKWREAKETDAANKVEWLAKVKVSLAKQWADYAADLANYTDATSKKLDAYDNYYPRKPSPPRDLVPQTEEAWNDYYENNYNFKKAIGFKKPFASDHKSKIIAWMCFWPFSFLGTFINDPVRRFFNFIFSSFKKLYQKLSDKIFAGVE